MLRTILPDKASELPASAAKSDGAGRVLFIVENRPVAMDNRVVKQIDSLLASGYLVRAICQRHARNKMYSDCAAVELFEYPAPPEGTGVAGYLAEYGYSFLWAAALAVKVLRRERIDVVQFCQPPDMYFPLAPLFRRAGARVLVDQRDLMAELYAARYGKPSRALRWALRMSEKLSLRSADHIVCVNRYFRERAAAASGVPSDIISVVGNGPVLARVDAATGDESLKRGRKHLACWVGEISRQDRVDLLVKSAHHVVRELGRTDTLFAVIGDGECLAAAKSLVRELGIDDWVHFPGFLSYDQVFQYLATADIGLDASLQFEVSPVKAIEYMAAGLPQVAFDLPETRALADGSALFAKPGDIAGHARSIDALLADPGRRERLGRVARRRVRDELAWERQAVTYVETVARAKAAARAGRLGPPLAVTR